MQRSIKGDRVAFLIILFLFSLITAVHSFSFPGGSRVLPIFTGIIASGMIGLLIGSEFSARLSKAIGLYSGLVERMRVPDEDEKEEQEEISPWKRIFICWGWMLISFVVLYLVGFFIALPLYTLVQLWFFSKMKLSSSILATLIICGFVYFISTILQMELFPGVIFGGIVPPL